MEPLICLKLEGRTWYELLLPHIDEDHKFAFIDAPKTKLLSYYALEEGIGKGLAKKYLKIAEKNGIYPEVGANGDRRCVYIKDGTRCTKFNKGIMCVAHGAEIMGYSDYFKNETFKKRYEKFANSKEKLNLDGELSIMRVMIAEVLLKVKDPGDTPLELINGLTHMIEKTTKMVETIGKMNEITPEKVEALLDKVVDILVKFVPAEKLEEANSEVGKLSITSIQAPRGYEEGTLLEYNKEIKTVEVVKTDDKAAKQRAFEDTCRRLNLSTEDMKLLEEYREEKAANNVV